MQINKIDNSLLERKPPIKWSRVAARDNLVPISQQPQQEAEVVYGDAEKGESDQFKVKTADGQWVMLWVRDPSKYGVYTSHYGHSIESKYGYAEQFDDVSIEYASKMANRQYSAAPADVIKRMEAKYNEIKSGIEGKFEGKEKESRLWEMERTYKFFMKQNVIMQTESAISHEKTINEGRARMSQEWKKSAAKHGEDFANRAYMGNCSAWEESSKTVRQQLARYEGVFDHFQQALKEGKSNQADGMLKQLLSGLGDIWKVRG